MENSGERWLIVGLGNPGAEYEKTRHNLGFMLIELLATRLQTSVKRVECRSLFGRGEIGGKLVELAMPQTFMNLSGSAVGCLMSADERQETSLLVISDDIAIPFGTMRMRPKGSHGGQNGLRSIIDHLKTQDFARLRIGIGPDHPLTNASRFVLDKFSKNEAAELPDILDRAADAIETAVTSGIEAAMAKFN
ncbi:MAG TPA: aminoacyl-tRNA hydrolase [Pyrinomonadaceae bacterium]|nr:aminoacyl-tRNA hydrolase [Pyrinomonadaceae bacterium]